MLGLNLYLVLVNEIDLSLHSKVASVADDTRITTTSIRNAIKNHQDPNCGYK